MTVNSDDIDYSVFDATVIRQAVAALQAQPELDGTQIIENEHGYELAAARLDQIWSVYLPLSER